MDKISIYNIYYINEHTQRKRKAGIVIIDGHKHKASVQFSKTCRNFTTAEIGNIHDTLQQIETSSKQNTLTQDKINDTI
jgi:hypothetical protein